MVYRFGKKEIRGFRGDVMLTISFNDGKSSISIDLDLFFPTTSAQLKRLLKTIDLDFIHRDELTETLKTYLQNRIKDPELKRIYKSEYIKHLKIIEERK